MDRFQNIHRYLLVAAAILAVTGCTQPGTVTVAPGAATVAPGAVDANAVVTAMLASPQFNARLDANAVVTAVLASPQIDSKLENLVKVVITKANTTSASSGQQTAGEGGINIGTVLLNGSSGILIAGLVGAAAVAFVVWKLRKNRVLTDMLIKYNEEQKLDKPAQEEIRNMALSRGVEPLLKSRLKKVRKELNNG